MKAIIWDLGGTLIDTFTANIENLKRLLKQENIKECNDIKIMSLMKKSITDTVRYYKDEYGLSDKAVEEFLYLNKNIKGEETALYPDTREVLKWISNQGKMNFLLTHRGKSTIELLKYYDILQYFTECVTKEYNFKRKPSPEALIYLIEKYKLNTDDIIVVGDRKIDIETARNAHI